MNILKRVGWDLSSTSTSSALHPDSLSETRSMRNDSSSSLSSHISNQSHISSHSLKTPTKSDNNQGKEVEEMKGSSANQDELQFSVFFIFLLDLYIFNIINRTPFSNPPQLLRSLRKRRGRSQRHQSGNWGSFRGSYPPL